MPLPYGLYLKYLFYSELKEGKRSRGGDLLRYKDTTKRLTLQIVRKLQLEVRSS